MSRTRNKLCLLLLALCILLCGCETGDATVGNEKTVPLDRIIDALRSGGVSTYESAFPQTFCEQYQTNAGDLQEHLRLLLEAARSYDLDRYGEDVQITYTLTDAERYDTSLLEPFYQALAPDFVYALPTESVTDAAEINMTVYFKGSYLEETFDCTYLTLCIDGNWYLHPKHFGTVLKK